MNVQEQFEITWRDGHREPSCAPNPAYPAGVDLDISKGAQTTCKVALPYPAKRIGGYVIECHRCGIGVACTTAGRPDDPRSITIACKAMS